MQRAFSRLATACGVVGVLACPSQGLAAAPAQAVSIFDSYVSAVEARLAEEHRSREGFLAGEAGNAEGEQRMRRGEVIVEPVTGPEGMELPGALLHDWRGSAFAPGGKAADFERMLRDFGGYPRYFAPQVMAARTIAEDGDRVEGWMRVRQRQGITVVMDSTYDVQFGRLDAEDGWSASRSTRIAEVHAAGTSRERELGPQEEHGFLWRMNSYWSWEERDGGLYVQVESVSLTRGIPVGLGWVVKPFVESIPRESLEFTLASATRAAEAGSWKQEAGR